jgi:integrase
MGIAKRDNSKYWYIQFQLNGKTYIRSSKTTDKKLAELIEADWRRKLIEQDMFGTRDRISLAEAFRLFCESKTELADHSNLVRNASVIVDFLHCRRFLDELTTGDIERLRLDMQAKGYQNQTTKHRIATVRGAIKYCSRMGYQIPTVEYPTLRISKGKLRYLSFDEEKRLLEAVDPYRTVKGLPPYDQRTKETVREMHDLHDFLIMLIDTGARYSEISTLQWQRVDLASKSLSLWRPKVKNESILYMTDRVYQVLTRRIAVKTTEFVFNNRRGEARNYVAATIRKAFKRAGLAGCSAHTLRHTHATRLIQNGLNIYEVKEILGHADIKTTMRYAHIEQRTVSFKAREVMDRLNKDNITIPPQTLLTVESFKSSTMGLKTRT